MSCLCFRRTALVGAAKGCELLTLIFMTARTPKNRGLRQLLQRTRFADAKALLNKSSKTLHAITSPLNLACTTNLLANRKKAEKSAALSI